MTIAGLWRYGDWRHVATGCTALVQIERLLCRRLDVVNFKEIGSLGRVKGAPHRFRFFLAEVRDFFLHFAPFIHRESKKGCHPNHGYNFVNSWWICKILSPLQRAVNFQQNQYWVAHYTLSMLLLYLGKLKNQKFALCMHVKHVLSVAFYHLCNRCLPNVMKINVKINTMQNTNILLFVRSLSLTYWRNA